LRKAERETERRGDRVKQGYRIPSLESLPRFGGVLGVGSFLRSYTEEIRRRHRGTQRLSIKKGSF